MKKIWLCFFCVAFLAACVPADKEQSEFRVVSTTNLIADALDYLAGDLCEVKSLMGPGVDPHLYKASQGDLALLSEADLIVYNGLHLEGKMAGLFEKLAKTRGKDAVLSLGKMVNKEKLIVLDEKNQLTDPHIWFDHELWLQALSCVQKVLVAKLPQHADTLNARWIRYQAEVQKASMQWKGSFEDLPAEKKILITSHDAFHYLGRSYGIRVHGLQGISTIGEYGIQDISRLSDTIITHKVAAIFTESSVNPKSIEALRENCLRKGHAVKVGGELFSDALGAKGTPEGTYSGMLHHNLQTIYQALK